MHVSVASLLAPEPPTSESPDLLSNSVNIFVVEAVKILESICGAVMTPITAQWLLCLVKVSVYPVSMPATCYLLFCPRICWPRNTALFQSSCWIRQAQFLPFHLQSVFKHTNPHQYHYFSDKIGWIIDLCHRVVLKIELIWTKHFRRAVW